MICEQRKRKTRNRNANYMHFLSKMTLFVRKCISLPFFGPHGCFGSVLVSSVIKNMDHVQPSCDVHLEVIVRGGIH